MKRILFIFIAFLPFINLSAQSDFDSFFQKTNSLLSKSVTNGKVDYSSLKNNSAFKELIQFINEKDVSNEKDNVKKAYRINAYNLLVINQVIENFPLSSVQEVGGFFDRNKFTIGGEKLTLNQFEKQYLLEEFNDARLHFVLVCGALGCPPITNFAYMPERLESQIDKQTRLALNDDKFIRVKDGKVKLSQIFNWYTKDFGKNNTDIITYINDFRKSAIPNNGSFGYYSYDWSLNGTSDTRGASSNATGPTNASRYIVSSTIPKGSVELKVFNNLYSQKTKSGDEFVDRNSFFTTTLSALYGLTNRFNIGINTRFRKIRNNEASSSPFSVFGRDEGNPFSSRSGITAFGPQIRYAPVPAWENFSIQSSFVFAVGDELTDAQDKPFIDWDGATWNTQFFNDFPIGSQFSLFTEIDLLIEDIGKEAEGRANQVSTPLTAILAYTPTTQYTAYFLSNYAPIWQEEFSYFYQFGLGSKYQFTPNVELELLYSYFRTKFLVDSGGTAQTINLGLRFNF